MTAPAAPRPALPSTYPHPTPSYAPPGRLVRQRGRRGGAAYVLGVPAQTADGPAAAVVGPRLVYWHQAWTGAAVIFSFLVARVSDAVPRLAIVRPVILSCLVILALHAIKTPLATWQAAARDKQVRRAFLYVALAVVTVPFAIWPGGSAATVQPMTYGLVLVLAFSLTPANPRTLDRILTVGLAAAAFAGLMAVLAGYTVEDGRLTTAGSLDPNDLAAVMDVMFFLALGRTMRGRVWQRVLAAAAAVVLAVVSMKTASRGGAIGLGLGLLVFTLGLRPRGIAVAALVGALALPAAWTFGPDTFRARVATLVSLDEDYNTNTTSGRSYIWKRGVVFFAERPVIGIGPGNFETRLGRDFGAQGMGGAWHTAHNTVVQVFVELGLFGGVLLLLMVGTSLREAARYWRATKHGRLTALARRGLHRPEFLAAFAAYTAAAFFLSHAYAYLTFGVIALGGYLGRVARAEAPAPRSA